MPLILAIEPDKKQASQLTALVRGRLHAELILGDNAERALAALGHRVPDLILTSALLSPKDETALGERLRALDATAAAYVQTLTTPVLASPNGRGLTGGRASGMLSALRREKAAPATQAGCDPAVFAEQCQEYLERAATERAAMAERTADAAERMDAQSIAATPIVHAEPSAPIDSDSEPLYTSSYTEPAYRDNEKAPLYSYAAPVEPIEPPTDFVEPLSAASDAAPFIEPFVEPVIEPAFEPAVASVVAAPPPDAQPELRSFFGFRCDDTDGPASLLAAVAALAAEEAVVAVEVERAHAAPVIDEAPVIEELMDEAAIEEPIAAHASAPYQFVDLDLSELLDDPALAESGRRTQRARVDEIDEETVSIYELDASTLADFEAAVPRLVTSEESEPEATWSETELYMPLPRGTMLRWPMLAVAGETPRPVVVAVAEEPDEMKEWLDIIEALRRDAAMEPRPLSATATVTPPAPEDLLEDASGRKRRKRALDAPAQDEWGFFDPEQCGFQALLAKLEEITEDDRRTPRHS